MPELQIKYYLKFQNDKQSQKKRNGEILLGAHEKENVPFCTCYSDWVILLLITFFESLRYECLRCFSPEIKSLIENTFAFSWVWKFLKVRMEWYFL